MRIRLGGDPLEFAGDGATQLIVFRAEGKPWIVASVVTPHRQVAVGVRLPPVASVDVPVQVIPRVAEDLIVAAAETGVQRAARELHGLTQQGKIQQESGPFGISKVGEVIGRSWIQE